MTKASKVKLILIGLSLLLPLAVASGPARFSLSLAAPAGLNAGVVKILSVQSEAHHKIEQVLSGLSPEYVYSLSLAVDSPRRFGPEDSLTIQLRDAGRELVRKSLHLGDPDFYVTFRPTVAGDGKVILEPTGGAASAYPYKLQVLQWKPSPGGEVDVAAEPNNNWREATPIRLGTTVFGAGDTHLYIPLLGQNEKQAIEGGEDWFRFEFTADKPQLVFFMLDLAERDNIPVDVSVYRVENGEPKKYEEGMDPVTPPHEVQALAGNKFTTRVLKEKGAYYIRVLANHPFYQLRTRVYDVPPYTDTRQAVRTAVDYIISAGDSWHANTPRKGGVYDRVANIHQETSLCVACHATHFPQRAQLYSLKNGYPIQQRPQLQFLAERFYNNPRPFYGHPGAVWSRVISAPANVLSRMGALLSIYEHEVTHERRDSFFKGVGEYLKLYYKARTKLPPDESNGNTPIVSTYEVAWYSWVVLNELYQRTGDKSYLEHCDHLRRLIESTEHKNMLDLCYQTLAFCTIDRKGYDERIRKNGEKILSYQRPSGQWALSFAADAPEAEFQTGHCLWALATAGYSPQDPRMAKAVDYLLQRQQSFGGWFDPLQPYENFRTPFRETQMSVLALSELYKGPAYKGRGGDQRMGWGQAFPAPPTRLDFTSVSRLLQDLDNIWDAPSPTLLADVATAAKHDDALVRQAATACLGRVGDATAIVPLRRALGDDSKIVQRTAAWSLRQLAGRRGLGLDAIRTALADTNDRVRWGAARVFATHFSYLAGHTDLAESLVHLAQDPVVTIRMQALKGLWQWWYWNDDERVRGRIEDTFITRLAEPEHPWVRRNLQEGLYNIADENIRYLYNNWVPLLGAPPDREQAIRARLATERRLADKVSHALQIGNERQRAGVLSGLSEFHLRNADSYDVNKKSARTDGTLYVRIGNDVETVQFFGESVEVLARALRPILDSPNPDLRRLATKASFMLREVRMAKGKSGSPNSDIRDVVALAGSYEEGRQLLAQALYRRLVDPDAAVRAVAKDVYKSFTLDTEKHRTEVTELLRDLLTSPYADAHVAALEAIGTSGRALADAPGLSEEARKYLLAAKASEQAVALRALRSFPQLGSDPEVLGRVEKALVSDDMRLLSAAVELALEMPAIGQHAKVAPRLDRAFATKDSKKRKALLDMMAANRAWLADRRAVSLISEGLVDPEAGVVNSALGLVRQERALQKNPAILAALADLRTNQKATSATRHLADNLYLGQNPSDAIPARVETANARVLDYAYFANKVQPILAARGQDGNACVQCHASHAIFKLNPPDRAGQYTLEQLRENYRSALKVVDLLEPEKSLILRKPTSTSESEGVVGSDRLSHGGGVRWSADSPEYRTILEWIHGARLASARTPAR